MPRERIIPAFLILENRWVAFETIPNEQILKEERVKFQPDLSFIVTESADFEINMPLVPAALANLPPLKALNSILLINENNEILGLKVFVLLN